MVIRRIYHDAHLCSLLSDLSRLPFVDVANLWRRRYMCEPYRLIGLLHAAITNRCESIHGRDDRVFSTHYFSFHNKL